MTSETRIIKTESSIFLSIFRLNKMNLIKIGFFLYSNRSTIKSDFIVDRFEYRKKPIFMRFILFNRKMLKKILLSVLIILVSLVIWQWSLVNYGVRMGYGQLKIIWNAKPVETFLNDPSFPDSLKA